MKTVHDFYAVLNKRKLFYQLFRTPHSKRLYLSRLRLSRRFNLCAHTVTT